MLENVTIVLGAYLDHEEIKASDILRVGRSIFKDGIDYFVMTRDNVVHMISKEDYEAIINITGLNPVVYVD